MSNGPPPDYVEVKDRITAFYAKYPEGSLRCKRMTTFQMGDDHFLVYVAQAYRHPEDPAPAEGAAWEPVPGKTNFTRDSELMNAETSAWGRAIAALGFEVHKGIASANEVRARQGGSGRMREGKPSPMPSEKQLDLIVRKAKELGADDSDQMLVRSYVSEELTGGRDGSASKVIDKLMGDEGADTLVAMVSAANDWESHKSDTPADTDGLQQGELDESDMPWEPARG